MAATTVASRIDRDLEVLDLESMSKQTREKCCHRCGLPRVSAVEKAGNGTPFDHVPLGCSAWSIARTSTRLSKNVAPPPISVRADEVVLLAFERPRLNLFQ